MNNDIEFFNRCEYDAYFDGSQTPERRTYVIRNYGPGDSCIDACIEAIKCGVPNYIEVKDHRRHGDFLPHTVEFINKTDGSVVLKVCNFEADEKNYSASELISNPALLPNGNVDRFVEFYRIAS